MVDEALSEQSFEQQKQNCIFCKIVSGEIPSRKVFEDDHIVAVLDINPAAKGHLLVIPKEHYPILPLIPFDIMQHMFSRTLDLVKALKEAILCMGVTVFIANGAVAGQQSPHFLYHLIPRDENDGLNTLSAPTTGDRASNESLVASFSQRFSGFMQAYNNQTGNKFKSLSNNNQSMPPNNSSDSSQLDKLIELINTNDDLRDAIISRPQEVKEAAKTNPKWKELFEGVNIDELSNNLKAMVAARAKQTLVQDSSKANLDKIGEMFK